MCELSTRHRIRLPMAREGEFLALHNNAKIQTDSEDLLIIKTRESLLETLNEHVKANHEYNVLKVIAMPIMGGNEPYLEWLKNSTRDKLTYVAHDHSCRRSSFSST